MQHHHELAGCDVQMLQSVELNGFAYCCALIANLKRERTMPHVLSQKGAAMGAKGIQIREDEIRV